MRIYCKQILYEDTLSNLKRIILFFYLFFIRRSLLSSSSIFVPIYSFFLSSSSFLIFKDSWNCIHRIPFFFGVRSILTRVIVDHTLRDSCRCRRAGALLPVVSQRSALWPIGTLTYLARVRFCCWTSSLLIGSGGQGSSILAPSCVVGT